MTAVRRCHAYVPPGLAESLTAVVGLGMARQ